MGLCSRQASLGFFLSIFQSDLSLHIVASSCDSPTDFTLWASREGCLVTEYANKLLLKMSPRSPLVSCHVNNGAVPMRENGGRVADISAHFFFWSSEEDPPSSGLWQIKLTTCGYVVMSCGYERVIKRN